MTTTARVDRTRYLDLYCDCGDVLFTLSTESEREWKVGKDMRLHLAAAACDYGPGEILTERAFVALVHDTLDIGKKRRRVRRGAPVAGFCLDCLETLGIE